MHISRKGERTLYASNLYFYSVIFPLFLSLNVRYIDPDCSFVSGGRDLQLSAVFNCHFDNCNRKMVSLTVQKLIMTTRGHYFMQV